MTEAGGGEGVQKEGEGELGPPTIHFNSCVFVCKMKVTAPASWSCK